MPTMEQIREAFAKDSFSVGTLGCEIREAEPGRSLCAMPLRPMHRNLAGIPHGGAIFTLGDFAFSVAANAFAERVTLSLQHDITYFRPARGQVLLAEARCLKSGRSVSYYEVGITDELGTSVARMSVNGFTVEKKTADL